LEKELANVRLDLENTTQINRDLRQQNTELKQMVEERNYALVGYTVSDWPAAMLLMIADS
jgi:cell division septum initiation protein DivIVA